MPLTLTQSLRKWEPIVICFINELPYPFMLLFDSRLTETQFELLMILSAKNITKKKYTWKEIHLFLTEFWIWINYFNKNIII